MDIIEIIKKYFDESFNVSITEIKGGAINLTYHLIVDDGKNKKEYILQKMKSIFDTSIMKDIEFITQYLSGKNILIQNIIKTQNRENFVKDGDSWWRLLTYISGQTFQFISSPEQAKEAGRLVGEIHNTLVNCDYKFKFNLPHLHDTTFFIQKLKDILEKENNTEKYNQLKKTAFGVLTEYKKLPKNIILPKRIIHGDLKISNVLFDNNGKKALTLIDLDTFTHNTIAIELGDALRSWCMPEGEDSKIVTFDLAIYQKTLEGYFSTAKFLTLEEKNSIPFGVKLITLELATRFLIDAFEENYFILDSSKYQNLFEQNKKRAENQFQFFNKFSQIF